ncbi:MAG: hypothetical protein JW744_05395 [Candidatus Diapherotrites archaeon]|uniref:ATP-cone domain-containing protein n=1 Tax=Candidatus Iainarchaeum sp. TaxID=3101447 RepID=A0A939C561_9ARCH|nr:hypothetical protein [Candidatus Diapherotrites archaeon]
MAGKPINALIEKIADECKEANAGKWTITRVVKELNEIEAKDLKQLRQKALQLLQQLDPKAASIYASFQRMQVRTSREQIEAFDRGNIIKSLLKETDIPRGIAEKIGREVEDKIKDLEIENVNTALIRELVNVKLLEYGHENIRNQYTRLGLPVFDVRKRVERQAYACKEILTEYNLLEAIPKEAARMHLQNEIFIAGICDFSTKPIALVSEAKALENARDSALKAVEEANIFGKLSSWQPNIAGINLAVSHASKKRAASESAVLFARAARAVFLRKSAIPGFNTLYLFEPDWFQGKELARESSAAAANAILNAEGSVLENAVALDSKYKLKLLGKKIEAGIFLNCRNREWTLANGIATQAKGLCSFIGLNLTGIALKFRQNERAFLEELAKKAEAVKRLDSAKRKLIEERPYLKKQGIETEKLDSAIGLDSLLSAAGIAAGTERETEMLSMAEKILGEITSCLGPSWAVAELQSKAALQRFAKQNKSSFGFSRQPLEEEKTLRKSSHVQKSYCFTARAETRKELNELIDGNCRLVEFREKEN